MSTATIDPAKLTGLIPQQSSQPQPVQKRVFKSSIASMQMIAKDGTRIVFVRGMFFTDNPNLINYLDTEIRIGNPNIYVDEDEKFYVPEQHDPIARLRKSMRDEILAEIMEQQKIASGNINRNMGVSVQSQINPANTTSIAAVAAGSGPTK
jgi:hypothetical protein